MAKRRLRNNDVVILSAVRSPIGKFGGALKDYSAPKLAGPAIRQVLVDAGLDPKKVDEIIMGHVLKAGTGQNPAQQAGFCGGLSHFCESYSSDEVCASSLRALWIAHDSVLLRDKIIVAGGMESMSQAPFLIAREQLALLNSNPPVSDSILHDGLRDAYGEGNPHMGVFADQLARDFPSFLSRKQQDEYSFESHRRAFASRKLGAQTLGICDTGYPIVSDEGVRKPNLEKMSRLNPVFGETITAGNASQLSDGAAALVVVSGKKSKKLGVRPIARIVAFAGHSQKPDLYTTAPIGAVSRALREAHIGIGDIDLIEVNEAFAVVPLYFMHGWRYPREKVNIWGGAIAQGHPIGASGAIRVVSLVHSLRYTGGRYGIAVACHGGGGAVAVVIENLQT